MLGLLCTNVVLKHLVARPRPWLDVAGLVPLIQEPDPNSFPSCLLYTSASTMVPSEVLPNSSLKSTRVTPHSARVFFRKSLTWKAYFLMVSISSQVASFKMCIRDRVRPAGRGALLPGVL